MKTSPFLLPFLSMILTRTAAFSVVNSSGYRSVASCTKIGTRRNNTCGAGVGNVILSILISASTFLGPNPALADGMYLFITFRISLRTWSLQTVHPYERHVFQVRRRISGSRPLTSQIKLVVNLAHQKWAKPMLHVINCMT